MSILDRFRRKAEPVTQAAADPHRMVSKEPATNVEQAQMNREVMEAQMATSRAKREEDTQSREP